MRIFAALKLKIIDSECNMRMVLDITEPNYKSKTSKAIEITTALILFALGGSIYIAFRTTSLRMFGWFDYLGLTDSIIAFRNVFGSIQIPEIVKFCIPDGLWSLSYVILMDAIWSPDTKKQVVFCGIIPAIGAISEILQYFCIVEGVFDVADLLCYLIPYVIYLFLKFIL